MGGLKVSTLKRGMMTSLFVGTALIAINHWTLVTTGSLPPAWQIILTYLVPFAVSVASSHMASREHARAVAGGADT